MKKVAKKKAESVFEQIGFSREESADLERRSILLIELQAIVERNKFTQKELGALLGQKQPVVSDLLRNRIHKFSTDRLIGFLEKLGATVEIRVKMPKKRSA